MNKENNLTGILGDKSMLNVEAQKELVDHIIEKNTSNALKIFFIIFPVTLLTIFGILYLVFHFVTTTQR